MVYNNQLLCTYIVIIIRENLTLFLWRSFTRIFFLFIAWYSTARGFECGAALTFVCPTDEDRLTEVEERLRGDAGEKIIILYMRII